MNADHGISSSIKGLFVGTVSRWTPNILGPVGSGPFLFITRYFGFYPGGGIFRADHDLSFAAEFLATDFNDADFIRLQHKRPSQTGTYKIRGNQLLINLPGNSSTRISGYVHDSDTVEIGKVVYKRVRGQRGRSPA